jgi:hypothetical protein
MKRDPCLRHTSGAWRSISSASSPRAGDAHDDRGASTRTCSRQSRKGRTIRRLARENSPSRAACMSPRPRASSTGGLPVAVACASWSSIAPRRCRPANAADRLDIEPEVVRTVEASPKPAVQVPPPPKPDKKPRAPTPKDVDVTGSVKPTTRKT